jgi:hypothetical protein
MDTGLFLFDIWNETGKGLDIQKVESPALIAMLLMEVTSLQKMAIILGEDSKQAYFSELIAQLSSSLEHTWEETRQTFSYRDCDSSRSPARELYYPSEAKSEFEFQKSFYKPQRLQIHIYSNDEHTKNVSVKIYGKDPEELLITESFNNKNIHWVLGRAHLTTNHIFSMLDRIAIEGLDEKDRVLIETVDLSQCDISCFLPICTGEIKKDQAEAILNTILGTQNKNQNYGVPEAWKAGDELPKALPIRVNILWNTLIIEGMFRKGYVNEAQVLFTNMMNTIVQNFKGFDGFFPFYDWENQQPVGCRNAITGLAPIRLFLQIAGIKLFTPNRIANWGVNPFPWPIQIHWQGTSIVKENSSVKIIFSNGACYQSDTEESVLITPLKAN